MKIERKRKASKYDLVLVTAKYIIHQERKFDEKKLWAAVSGDIRSCFLPEEKDYVVALMKCLHLISNTQKDPRIIAQIHGVWVEEVYDLEQHYHELTTKGSKEALELLHLLA